MGQATYDPEPVIQHLDAIERELKALRQSLTDNYSTKPAQAAAPIQTSFTIPAIKWKVKGGADAQPGDGFAFAFARGRNGEEVLEYRDLLNRLAAGPITQNGFKINLSKDGKFLQRSKVE